MRKTQAFASIVASCFVALAGLAGAGVIAPAFAQDEDEDKTDRPARRAETLDPSVAKVLGEVFELTQTDQFQPALQKLNQLIAERGDKMKAYDKSITYQMRGSIKVSLEDYRGALQDFQTALNAGGLPAVQNDQLRYYIAQLYFQLEDYQSAISGLQQWIKAAQAAGTKVDCSAYYLLAAAYTQITPPNYRAALPPGEQSVACLTEPKKANYDLLNLLYSELNESTKRTSLLERMINFWPHERSYWTQLSGLYSQLGKDADAFAVLEVAYRAGLLKSEAEILTLVQYFSFYENPYRGAKLMEREMGTGTIKRNVKNLTLLSQLWSQAREHKRAIPVLQEASKLSDKGELSYRLGQVLLADEQYAKSEKALRAALKKGGMTPTQTGDTWLLLGTAVFSQAGPEDRDTRRRAREAFVKAQNYSNTAKQARDWVRYIDEVTKVEYSQDYLECLQIADTRKSDIERLKTQAQVCRLQSGGAECDTPLAQARALEKEAEKNICVLKGGAESAPKRLRTEINEPEGAEESAPAEEPAPAEENEQ